MKVQDILRRKGHQVFTVSMGLSILEAVQSLVEHNIGSLVVMEGDDPIGILTERDILRLTAGSAGRLASIPVGDVMTRELIITASDQELVEAMDLMTENKVRHLPVIDHGRLVGIISIGDVVNECRKVAEQENALLREYIQGGVR